MKAALKSKQKAQNLGNSHQEQANNTKKSICKKLANTTLSSPKRKTVKIPVVG